MQMEIVYRVVFKHVLQVYPHWLAYFQRNHGTGVSLSTIDGSNPTRIRDRTLRSRIQYGEVRLPTQ
jgi:uncharacterized damage-inducible protein DinB